MILENKYTALDTVRLLKKAGMMGLLTDNAWVQGEFVRPEIYEKHPGLSDDGYMDLTKKWGGPYAHNEVYMNAWHVERCCPMEENGWLPAPTVWEAAQWLIENRNVWVTALPDYETDDNGGNKEFVWLWNVRIMDPEDDSKMLTLTSFQTYDHCGSWEQAMGDGLFAAAWVLNSVKPENLFSINTSFNKLVPVIRRVRKAVEGHRKFVSEL